MSLQRDLVLTTTMSALSKRVELLTNIAIIIVAILLVIVIARRFVFTNHTPVQQAASHPSHPSLGTKLSLPDVDWSKSDKTLLLVLSQGCKYCDESASFYQRLVQEQARRKSFRLVAVLPQPDTDGRRYLNNLNVFIDEIKQLSPSAVGVRGTPTLLLVSSTGILTDAWVGKLSPEEEIEVLSRL
jgi:hypothetical protein